jgi:anaerobic selenocysteine-containing dehydrogenase
MSPSRRDFLATSATATAGLALGAPFAGPVGAAPAPRAPAAHARRATPVVVSDFSGFAYRNGGPRAPSSGPSGG